MRSWENNYTKVDIFVFETLLLINGFFFNEL